MTRSGVARTVLATPRMVLKRKVPDTFYPKLKMSPMKFKEKFAKETRIKYNTNTKILTV